MLQSVRERVLLRVVDVEQWTHEVIPSSEELKEGARSKGWLRKRQNDFVRKREFDQLRKLRNRDPATIASMARPSFFQSSITTDSDGRAVTLKKIDEIEAQMSKQWWKGKQDGVKPAEAAYPVSAKPPQSQGDQWSRTGAAKGEFSPITSVQPTPEMGFDQGQSTDFDATRPGVSAPGDIEAAENRRQAKPAKKPVSKYGDSSISGFSPSKLFSIELGDSLADTEMEEAAIRFANGDDAGAEACLLTALKLEDARPEAANGWAAALFDLYRSTGQHGKFDQVAAGYAERFGYAAPQWFSTPDLLEERAGNPAFEQVSLSKQTSPAIWECPAQLDLQTLHDLRASLAHAPEPWHLNWNRFKAIRPEAVEGMADLFAQWCVQPVILRFEGAEVLDKTLKSLTLSGDKSVPAVYWRMRLDALRIMRLQDEFELAALEFCVTYEVSPPPWQNAQCEYLVERTIPGLSRSQTDEFEPNAMYESDSQRDNAPTEPMAFDDISASVIELSGEVLGDASEALNKLQAGLRDANRLVITCDSLIRVDFAAAGSILNWVAARELEGRHVQFRDVPRLVAAFFNVIGVSEHARVMLRTS